MIPYLRSTLFFIVSVLFIMIYAILVIPAFLLPLSIRLFSIRTFLRIYLMLFESICGVHYEVEGLENIPSDRRFIVLSKHQSTWETFYLPILFHSPAIILKRELLWIPFFGWGLALFAPIAINRNEKSSAMQQIIHQGKAWLDADRSILVFPEGTRIPFGQVGHYKLGGAHLAEATGYPVIPVAHNAGYYWPKRCFLKKPGTIKVVIGPLIESKGRNAGEIMQLTKTWIEETVTRISRFVDKSTG